MGGWLNQATFLRDRHVGAVTPDDECPAGTACTHCAAGRPSAPVEAGDPRNLSMAVADVLPQLRQALPPAYHRPEWMREHGGYRCACCWDVVWPCPVAQRHGRYLDRSQRLEFTTARRAGLTLDASEPSPLE